MFNLLITGKKIKLQCLKKKKIIINITENIIHPRLTSSDIWISFSQYYQ